MANDVREALKRLRSAVSDDPTEADAVFAGSNPANDIEILLSEYDRLVARKALAFPVPAMPEREKIMFEFYRFSYPARWNFPHERMWEAFQACHGSLTWRECERSADAILALLRSDVTLSGQIASVLTCKAP